jgi:hypothetical protein
MYNYYNMGAFSYRDGIRAGAYVIDKLLTTIGWGGVENTDWTNILTIN